MDNTQNSKSTPRWTLVKRPGGELMLGESSGYRYAVAKGGDDGLYAYEVQTGVGLRTSRKHASGFATADEAEAAARAWIAANPLNDKDQPTSRERQPATPSTKEDQ